MDMMTDVGTATSTHWMQLWDPSFGSAAAQPMRRFGHAIATFQDDMYVFGGIATNSADEDVEFNDTWAFDLVGKTWTELPVGNNRPSNRFHHAGVLHTNTTVNEFVVFGGLSLMAAEANASQMANTNAVPVVQYNDIWRLSLGSGAPKWSRDPTPSNSSSVPDARSEAGIVIHNDKLFMFGGIAYDENGVNAPVDYNDLWCYDLSSCTWTEITPAGNLQPPTRFSHSVAVLNDATDGSEPYLLAYSGRHLLYSSWSLLNDAWVYDFSQNEWSSVASTTSVPRAYTSIVVTEGVDMWFFGGYYKSQQSSSGYVYDDTVLGKFDLKNMVMGAQRAVFNSNGASPPLRYSHRAALWQGDTMVIHGGSYQSQLGDIWAFNTSNAQTTDVMTNTTPLDPESLVYVLGAFIVTVVFVLLVLLFRWRRADRRNLRAAQLRGAAIVRGVTKERLDQLQITKYCRADRDLGSSTEQKTGEGDSAANNEDVCPICLIEFEDGEDVRNLPCKHIFHVACIDEWLKRNTLCPMCKSNVDLVAVDIAVETPPVPTSGRAGAVVIPVTTVATN